MQKLLTFPELQAILAPHADRLSGCVWSSWSKYVDEVSEEVRLTFDLSAEAKVINRLVVDAVKREFAGVPGTTLSSQYDYLIIEGFPHGVDGTALCRFKKLNCFGESRTYPTNRALRIRENNTATLDGIPPSSTFVDIGPVFNDWRTGFREVQAIRVKDKGFIMSLPREPGTVGTRPSSLAFEDGSGGVHGAGKRFEIRANKHAVSKEPTE